MSNTKIIAIDDDPTGSQTVHCCLLLTRWDPGTLTEALVDPSPLFFVLSNTRGMDAAQAAASRRRRSSDSGLRTSARISRSACADWAATSAARWMPRGRP